MRDLIFAGGFIGLLVLIVVFVIALVAHRREQHISDAAIDLYRSAIAWFRGPRG